MHAAASRSSHRATDYAVAPVAAYFSLAVLGFSFWFLMAVPFASHRESYWWLANVGSQGFSGAFSFISSTYRPFHQVVTWSGFMILDPSIFPTSLWRQSALQLLVYVLFIVAWWLLFRSAREQRVLALVALLAGGVFFSGYIHLFHIYGLSYVPVMLILGTLLGTWSSGTFDRYEMSLAAASTLLVLWHPFVTALFVAFYFGRYLETFSIRGPAQHARAVSVLLIGAAATLLMVFGLPFLLAETSELLVETASRPVGTRLFAWLVSYQTNEVHWVASIVAFLLALTAILSVGLARRTQAVALIVTCVLGGLLYIASVPQLVLWITAVLFKLGVRRYWSLFFLLVGAALLPIGGGIGTPVHALFALIVAVFATAVDWKNLEEALACVKPRYIGAAIAAAAATVWILRAGVDVPVLSSFARPLLAERERTYQLESALAWLRQSEFCNRDIVFVVTADNPIDSVENAISREGRPPAGLADVRAFWEAALRCRSGATPSTGEVVMTFGGPDIADANKLHTVPGRYAGELAVWSK